MDTHGTSPPTYIADGDADVYRPEVLKTIEDAIDRVSDDLRALSLEIHAHPELMFKEKSASSCFTQIASVDTIS